MTPAEMLNIFRSNIVVVRGIPTADPESGRTFHTIAEDRRHRLEARAA